MRHRCVGFKAAGVREAGEIDAAAHTRTIIEVVCPLPSRDGEFQYRIKSSGEPYERVVRESELAHV